MNKFIYLTFLFSLIFGSAIAQNNSILLGPSLNAPSESSVYVWWHTASETAEHKVEYGTTDRLGQTVELKSATRYPNVLLEGLQAGQEYFYRVTSGGSASAISSFKLPDPSKPLNIVFWSDNQSGYKVFTEKTVPAMAALNPDFMITAGDLVDTGGVYEQWEQQLYGPAQTLFSKVPWFAARGNHDYNGDVELARMMLPLPNNNQYYAQTYGPIRMVFLNTNIREVEQLKWLEMETQKPEWKNAKYRMVVCHHPPFTSLWDNPGYDGEALLRTQMVPLLEKSGADVLITGHAHDYERLERTRPDGKKMHYLIIGGGGGTLDTIEVYKWPYSRELHSTFHILQADVNDKRIVFRAIDTSSNDDIDLFMIRASEGN